MPFTVDPNSALIPNLVNPQGIVSLQNAATAADAARIAGAASSGTKLMGFDPASIIFTTLVNLMMNRGDKDRPPAIEQTPEGLVDSLYNYLQSTEGQLQAGDTEGRDAQYQALLDQATKLGMTNITGEVAQNPYVTSFAANPVVAAQSAADTLLSQIKDFFPFYDQAQLVLNPVTGTGNIVFGTPPTGQPVIQAGQLPRSNTNVGVTTGVPILDQAINSVLSKPGGLDSGSIRDSVIDIIAKQSGLDPATTATILGKDLETILATANADVANTAARVGINLMPEKKDDVVKDDAVDIVTAGPQLPTKPLPYTGTIKGPQVYPEVDTIKTPPIIKTGANDAVIKTGAADAVDIVTGAADSVIKTGAGDTSVVTGAGDAVIKTGAGDSVIKTGAGDTSVVTGAGDAVIKTGAADAVDIVTGAADSVIKTGAGDSSVVTGSLTPADLGEDTTVKTGAADSVIKTGGGGGGGGGGGAATPTPSQGMRMESTEKAGLADINSTFDLNSTFMENLMRALSGKDDTESEGSYYSGGKVAPYAGVDEIIRFLRG